MNRKLYIFILILVLAFSACRHAIVPDITKAEQPDLFPDYAGVTIPASIAPLNFKINDAYSAIHAEITGTDQSGFSVSGKKFIQWPPRKWSELLAINTGDSLRITVSIKQNGSWIQYAPFAIYISPDPIDYGLAYRLVAPGYEVYSKMGIYQRDLSTFQQSPIIENTLIPGSCVNCHSFRLTDPDYLNIHMRGPKGGTILKTGDEINLLNTKTPRTLSNFVYPFWHPSGNFLTYSVNNIKQVFHETKEKRVEVVDLASDVIVYDVKNNLTLYCDQLMSDSVFETFPTFSPDGRTLYFCASGAKEFPSEYQQVRYNLCSLAFDPETATFGTRVDTVFHASALGKSVTFPRPSPDGRYIMFTLTDYGNFSIWHDEADLYLLDVKTGECRALDAVNSNCTESYHSWSSNSRWFVFSSRRIDGLYTRPFIAHLDENGNPGKPFLLPQENPDHHDALLFSYNIPEFINQPVKLDMHQVEHLLHTEGTKVEQRE